MKRLRYIAILIVGLLTSCYNDSLDTMVNERPSGSSSDKVEIVARILPLEERDVTSRADDPDPDADNFTFEESDVTMMDFIIFNSEGTCVFYGHLDGNNLTMTLDRSVAFAGMDQNLLNSCTIYTVANFPENYNGVVSMAEQSGMTVEEYIQTKVVGVVTESFFDQYATKVTGITIPAHGLPMVGKTEGVDLSEDAVYAAGHMIKVDTKILYSKMVFNIVVEPDQVIPDIVGNMFKITSYEVHNLAQEVDVTGGTESVAGGNDGTNDATKVYTDPIVGQLSNSLTNHFLTDLNFTFYLPERFVKPATSADTYPYPFRNKEDSSIRDEDKNLRQRYKPKLVEGQTPPATFVRIKGTFLNHQGHAYDLVYDIYVGNDNYGNYDIVRSRQYNNTLVIRGIQNNNDQPLVGDVSIDHRVDVERTLPVTIGLRRETKLDSHWEVRPLRVRANDLSPSYVPNSACKVEITYLNGETTPWIGLEPSYGDGSTVNSVLYCTGANSSAGKRKYFTTDLVTSTLNRDSDDIDNDGFSDTGGQSVVVPVSASNDCVWVYVDECTEASQDITAKRSAKITLTYGLIVDVEGTKQFKGFHKYTDEEILQMIEDRELPANFVRVDPIEYTFMQHLLYEIVYNGQTYHIEHEEEYLHNFDTEDGFELNPTQDNGMAWGLNGAQLSFDNESLLFATSEGGGIISAVENIVRNWVKSNLGLNGIYYDFYIPKHDTGVDEKATKRDYRGWVFCNEIIADINGTADRDSAYDTKFSGTIGNLALDEQPSSAIEYCLNKNKSGASMEWYLPAIDEIEDIMTAEYGAFDGVFQNNFYWSSQPAFYKNYCYKEAGFLVVGARAEYYLDDTARARATKIERRWSDESSAYIYYNVPSGTVDYVKGLEITGWAGNYNGNFVASGTTLGGKNIVGEINPEDGNLARTQKARVRCLRKNTETNTSTTE